MIQLIGPLAHVAHVAIVPGHDYRGCYELMRHLLAVGEARGFEPATSQARFLVNCGLPQMLDVHPEPAGWPHWPSRRSFSSGAVPPPHQGGPRRRVG